MDEIGKILSKAWKTIVGVFACLAFVVTPILKECTSNDSIVESSTVHDDYDSSSENTTSSSRSDNNYYVSPRDNSYSGNYENNYNDNYSNDDSYSASSEVERVWHDCSLCRGKGKIVKNYNTPTYGMEDSRVYCDECGRSYYQSTGHRHITCPTCHGNGGFWSD